MEKYPRPEQYAQETALVQRIARIFGYRGLNVEFSPGAGWQTRFDNRGVTLVADPEMLHPTDLKDAMGNELPSGAQIPEHYSVYGVAHELGHIDDHMHAKGGLPGSQGPSASEGFFWSTLSDGVINRRLRNIPLLNALTDEVYEQTLFPVDDYTELPKHVQFMYGWLLRNVTPQRQVTFSEDVSRALDSLSDVQVGRKHVDLYRTLSHYKTDYDKRQELAREHILPIYNQFLEEDKSQPKDDGDQEKPDSAGDNGGNNKAPDGGQQGGQGEGDGEGSGGGSDASELYEAYEQAAHGGGHNANANPNDASGQTIEEVLQEVADALKAAQQQGGQQQGQPGQGGQAGASRGGGAGTVQAELMLGPDDAAAYVATIERYRNQIHDTATAMESLAVPSVEYTSPRYRERADTNGLKLSPRELFRVVIAQHSNADPAVWRPVETTKRREGMSFNGLDIHLVVDVSGSMSGSKADAAAACGVMLTEGTEQARRSIERQNPRAPKPDVRFEEILFGASSRIVIPIGYETEPSKKGVAFSTIRRADSGSTLAADALRHTVEAAKRSPERTHLIYLITDGDFGDFSAIRQILSTAGPNFILYQYILQSPGTAPVTKNVTYLNDPVEMPRHMHRQLRDLAASLQP